MKFILDYLRSGDALIDVGANVGLYTLLACSAVGESGCVHAFEPNAEVAAKLRETLDLNGAANVTVHEVGLSDASGFSPFCIGDDDCMSHLSTGGADEARVKVDRLDHFLEEIPCAMIKIDVEGWELSVIKGASGWTEHGNPPVMLVEIAGYGRRYGVGTTEIIDELKRMGYFTAVYEPETKHLRPVAKPWEVSVDNVLAIFEAKVDFVQSRLQNAAGL